MLLSMALLGLIAQDPIERDLAARWTWEWIYWIIGYSGLCEEEPTKPLITDFQSDFESEDG
jgi:hypothetical protein